MIRIAALCALIAITLFHPAQIAETARQSLAIWGLDVVPSLFPYMVLCRMLASSLSKIDRLPPSLAILALGLAGGSPSGASVLASYAENGKLSAEQIRGYAALTGTISPMFLTGTVNGWLNGLGYWLFGVHLISAMLVACLVGAWNRSQDFRQTVEKNSLTAMNQNHPIEACALSVLNVGGCIVFFRMIAEGIRLLVPSLPELWSVLFSGFLEISGAMHALSLLSVSREVQFCIGALFCGFGGISIISQNALFLDPFGVSFRQLLRYAVLRAAISLLLAGGIIALSGGF